MRLKISFICLLLLLFIHCSRKAFVYDDVYAFYSSFDDKCDTGYDPDFVIWKSDDTCNGYIDITYGSVSIDQNRIVCTLTVTNLPDTLLFNNDSLELWNMEYWWEFAFQNKIDTTQFIYIGTGQYKDYDAPQWYGRFSDYMFSGLAIYKRGDAAIFYKYPVECIKTGNTLTMAFYDHDDLGIAEFILHSSIKVTTRLWTNTSPDNIIDQMIILN